MVVGGLVFLAIGLANGSRVARMLELNRAIGDTKTGFLIEKTYEDDSLEWRVDGGRDEVGGDRDTSCTMPPAILRVQY